VISPSSVPEGGFIGCSPEALVVVIPEMIRNREIIGNIYRVLIEMYGFLFCEVAFIQGDNSIGFHPIRLFRLEKYLQNCPESGIAIFLFPPYV
jgi:hypothetical protein